MRNAPRRAGKNSRAERPVPAFRAAALRAGSDARRLRGDGPVGSAPRLSRGAARLRPGREAGGRARPGARFRRPGDEERGRRRGPPPRCRLARHAGPHRGGLAQGPAVAGVRALARARGERGGGARAHEPLGGAAATALGPRGGRPRAGGGPPLPPSAAAWPASRLCVRLSGAEPAVRAAAAKIGGTRVEAGQFWEGVREHRHAFFDGPQPLWRVAVPSVCPPLGASGDSLIEWGGALRWLRGAEARALAAKADGHATLFRSQGKRESVFAALDPRVMTLHRRLKAAFDPAGILNPGRLYAEL